MTIVLEIRTIVQRGRATTAVNVKRVKRYVIPDYFDERVQGLDFIEAVTETKTTWHPIGV